MSTLEGPEARNMLSLRCTEWQGGRTLGGRTFLIRKCHQMQPGELRAPVARPQPCFKIQSKFLKIQMPQGYMEELRTNAFTCI